MNLTTEKIMLSIIIINILIMVILVVVAIRQAYAHAKTKVEEVEDEPKTQPRPRPEMPSLSKDIRKKLLDSSELHFQKVINRSATTLERDLKSTTSKLTRQLDKVGSEIILTEMKRYRKDLESLRRQAETIIEQAQRDIVISQGELKDELAQKQAEQELALKQEIDAQKQDLSKRINENLSDSVVAFLTESMKHEIDLGAQAEYLTNTLNQHKAELIKEIMDEA